MPDGDAMLDLLVVPNASLLESVPEAPSNYELYGTGNPPCRGPVSGGQGSSAGGHRPLESHQDNVVP